VRKCSFRWLCWRPNGSIHFNRQWVITDFKVVIWLSRSSSLIKNSYHWWSLCWQRTP
jgi:hypothetical protein